MVGCGCKPNLDAKLRVQTRTQIANLQRRMGVTTVYITHDQTEALTMGDRIAVLNFGVLQQVDSPRELYERPVNVFVAGFIGSPAMNLATFTVDGNVARAGEASIPLDDVTVASVSRETTREVLLGFRPEAAEIVEQGAAGTFPIEVDFVEELGSDAYIYHLRPPRRRRRAAGARRPGRRRFRVARQPHRGAHPAADRRKARRRCQRPRQPCRRARVLRGDGGAALGLVGRPRQPVPSVLAGWRSGSLDELQLDKVSKVRADRSKGHANFLRELAGRKRLPIRKSGEELHQGNLGIIQIRR